MPHESDDSDNVLFMYIRPDCPHCVDRMNELGETHIDLRMRTQIVPITRGEFGIKAVPEIYVKENGKWIKVPSSAVMKMAAVSKGCTSRGSLCDQRMVQFALMK